MKYQITKTFKLDMGHRTWNQDMRKGRGHHFFSPQVGYPYNKCANIHGHSLIVSITLSSDDLDHQNFVMDTDLFKVPFLKIINSMDHAFVIDSHDPLFADFQNMAKKEDLRLYIVDFSPSFEALAKYFFDKMQEIVDACPDASSIQVVEAKVTGEHMTVEASYRPCP